MWRDPTIDEFVRNALDFAYENHHVGPFKESDVNYVIADTRRRVREGDMPKLRSES